MGPPVFIASGGPNPCRDGEFPAATGLPAPPPSPRPGPPRAAWRGGRVVECTALEMRHRCKPIGGSNPSLSATEAMISLEKISYQVFSRDFRGLAAVTARVAH